MTQEKPAPSEALAPKCSTGIDGLDRVLQGGLPRNRFYLIQGDPGVGKTTLGLQFLLQGLEVGEPGLYVTLSETHQELLGVAASHGWSLDKLDIFELSAIEETLAAESQNTLFHPSEIELNHITNILKNKVAEVKPSRIVFDSLSELRLLAQNPLRYRRQLLSLKQFFVGRNCTVLVMDDRTSDGSDREVQSIAHGVLAMERMAPEYGTDRRRLSVIKLRGEAFRGGYHDFLITKGGLVVFPRLIAAEHRSDYPAQSLSSDIPQLDDLLSGGLDRGTSTLFTGPPGTGKSTLGSQFASAAADRGENVAVFTFDEKIETYIQRADALGMKLSEHIATGRAEAVQVNPAEMSPGEFAHRIRRAVEKRGVRLVIIDSLNGYLNAMPEERFLTIQMHELLSYLAQQGVATILILAQHGLVGSMHSPVDVTYLADTVLILRYFEVEGAVKQAVSVIKKRSGNHERTIREFKIQSGGVHVGAPLKEFHGVLTGVPTYQGSPEDIMKGKGGNGHT